MALLKRKKEKKNWLYIYIYKSAFSAYDDADLVVSLKLFKHFNFTPKAAVRINMSAYNSFGTHYKSSL